jgi:hypothetical protein
MRLRSQLFYVFLAVLLVAASIVEASKGHKKKKGKKKSKGKKPALTTPSGSGGETPVVRNSVPSLESGTAKDNKASVGEAPSTVEGGRSDVVSSAVSESGAERDDVFGKEFREAVDRENFGWLNVHLRDWKDRGDLPDDVIAKGADVTVWFIQRVGKAKRFILAALFDKGEKGMIDDVLKKVEYNDYDLVHLTSYRPELASSPEKFFRVLDKIKDPKIQEIAVSEGVENLFDAGKHDLIVTLVNAFGKRTFKNDRLKDVVIQWTFYEGTQRGNQDIVELYYEHPAIASERYARGLMNSWHLVKPNQVFPFLLKQADQGDLMHAKEKYAEKWLEQFRQAIDKAPKPAPPAGSRIISVEKVQRVLEVLASIINVSDEYGPSSIIKEYLLGEKEKTKGGESEGQEAGTENLTD